jgi:hypothetical protein
MMAARLVVGQAVLDAISAWFRQAAEAEIEDMAVLLGHVSSTGDFVVTSALRPDLERHAGFYEQRPGDGWDALYARAEHLGLRLLAQVHIHPGAWTGHSPRDDLGAVSDKVGFLSLVLPHFGRAGFTLTGSFSVHERTRQGWRPWSDEERRTRLQAVPSALDLQTDGAP